MNLGKRSPYSGFRSGSQGTVDLWWSGGFQAQVITTRYTFLAFRPSLCSSETPAQCIPSEQPSAKRSAKHKGRDKVQAAETLGNSADSLGKALVRPLAFGEEKPPVKLPPKRKEKKNKGRKEKERKSKGVVWCVEAG